MQVIVLVLIVVTWIVIVRRQRSTCLWYTPRLGQLVLPSVEYLKERNAQIKIERMHGAKRRFLSIAVFDILESRHVVLNADTSYV
jgi:hypothetical protein